MMSDQKDRLREKIAELEHEQWVVWAGHLISVEHLSHERLERWQKLMVSYSQLTEEQKDQDRIWADKSIVLIEPLIKDAKAQVISTIVNNLLNAGIIAKAKDGEIFVEGYITDESSRIKDAREQEKKEWVKLLLAYDHPILNKRSNCLIPSGEWQALKEE